MTHACFRLLALMLLLLAARPAGAQFQIACDFAKPAGPVSLTWQSTGFTPAELLLSPPMQQQMAWAGALPHGAIQHVRIHYLLDLVTPKAEGGGYDFSRLDQGLDVLARNGLKPFFELMGNPGGRFTRYQDPAQMRAWRDLVRELANHLIARYGREEVRTWFFETWNEPDIKFWKQSFEDFLCYYDACSAGLAEADPQIRFGGPGVADADSKFIYDFLAYCESGRNRLSGAVGSRLDFISVHIKGGQGKGGTCPNALAIHEKTLALADYIREHHPKLARVPLFNDECDPLVGWGNWHDWRTGPYYAALITQILNQHEAGLIDRHKIPFALLSNDHGFVGNWGQRTLCAMLGTKSDKAERFDMVRKPGLTVMGLWALLGDRQCEVKLPLRRPDYLYSIGALATARGQEQYAALVYSCVDNPYLEGSSRVNLKVVGLPEGRWRMAHYRLDALHGNPYAAWQALGSPERPSLEQLAQLRRHEEPVLLEEPREVAGGPGDLNLELTLPASAVSLILFSRDGGQPPAAPTALRLERYTGLSGEPQHLILWKQQGAGARTIRGYEIQYAEQAGGPWRTLSAADQLQTAYLHAPAPATGFYQVRALDYWGRPSAPSAPLALGR